MAEHAHTTPALATAPLDRSRRHLLAGIGGAALVGSACITPASAAPRTDNGEAALLAYYRGLDANRQAAFLGSMEIAAAAKPTAEHPDAELLAACARFEALEAAYRISCDTNLNTDLHCPDGYQEAMEAVENTPARTFAGMQAKARAIIAFHEPEYLGHEDMMWSLVQDVAGRSGRSSGLDGEV